MKISDVKRAATGKGGGKGTAKADMLRAARARWPHLVFEDDNAADAAFIGRALRVELGLEKPYYREEDRSDSQQKRLPIRR